MLMVNNIAKYDEVEQNVAQVLHGRRDVRCHHLYLGASLLPSSMAATFPVVPVGITNS